MKSSPLLEASDAVFTALADPTRRQVLRLVAERGPASATSLERELPVSRQAIVKHLVVLRRAGLVVGQRQGQEVRYGLVPEPLGEAAEWIADTGARWDARLDRLRAYLLANAVELDSERIPKQTHEHVPVDERA